MCAWYDMFITLYRFMIQFEMLTLLQHTTTCDITHGNDFKHTEYTSNK